VGRELGVRYVLEGSVRKAGERVRVSSQLIETETSVHLWAERYDRRLDDLFALQDEITLNVVGAIEPSLREAEIERVKRKRPENLDAYDLVLRALPHVFLPTPAEAAKAMPLLERALTLEPDYAGARLVPSDFIRPRRIQQREPRRSHLACARRSVLWPRRCDGAGPWRMCHIDDRT
jgi:adenylate cyclase